MDEKKKETEQENSVDSVNEASEEVAAETGTEAPATEAPETTEELATTEASETTEEPALAEELETTEESAAAEAAEGGAPVKKNKRLRNALIRVGCALVAAAILLAVSKFSIFDLKKGAAKTDAAQNEQMGSFVKQDVYLLLGDLSEQGLSGNYMMAAVVDKIVVIHFTDRYLASATEIKNDTLKYIDGDITTIDKYVTVEGTVTKQNEDLSKKVYSWFDANKSWMQEKGVIPQSSDAATYLSDAVLTVDTVNYMSETLVYALTGLAALLILYIIVELILMACGLYLKEPKKKLAMAGADVSEPDEKEESGDDAQEAAELTDNTEEKISADDAECIKDEEEPEDNGDSETVSEEKTEKQEDK